MDTVKTEIRPAMVEDLPKMGATASEFYASSRHLGTFNLEKFCASWRALLESGLAVIFVLWDGEEVAGAIGGVAYPDVNSFDLIAQEFFWFIRERNRRGTWGIRLYRLFEKWARARGCDQIRMGHMADSMPEQVKGIYLRLGFEHIESAYGKRLS